MAIVPRRSRSLRHRLRLSPPSPRPESPGARSRAAPAASPAAARGGGCRTPRACAAAPRRAIAGQASPDAIPMCADSAVSPAPIDHTCRSCTSRTPGIDASAPADRRVVEVRGHALHQHVGRLLQQLPRRAQDQQRRRRSTGSGRSASSRSTTMTAPATSAATEPSRSPITCSSAARALTEPSRATAARRRTRSPPGRRSATPSTVPPATGCGATQPARRLDDDRARRSPASRSR